MAKFCSQCGAGLSEESLFCSKCGASKTGAPAAGTPITAASGVPADSAGKQMIKRDRMFCIITAVLALASFMIPIGSISRGGRVVTWVTIFASAFTASDAATFAAFIAFIIPIIIFALFIIKLTFGSVLKGKLAILDTLRYLIAFGLSVLGIIFTISFMNAINNIFFSHTGPTTTSATPMFFIVMLAYLYMIGMSIKGMKTSSKSK